MPPPRSKPPRVVLDTNLVLSALVFSGGLTSVLRGGWQRQAFIPLASRETVDELIRVLGYPKFALDAREQEDLLADYLPFCTTVRIPVPPPPTPTCRDPFDVPFLELAIAGDAAFLVTGDHDLLSLAWNKRDQERKRPGAVGPWEVGVAGPEANPAHSEAKCRAGYGALSGEFPCPIVKADEFIARLEPT